MVANAEPRKNGGDSLCWPVKGKGKVGNNAKRKTSGNRFGLHGLLLGPLVFEALKK